MMNQLKFNFIKHSSLNCSICEPTKTGRKCKKRETSVQIPVKNQTHGCINNSQENNTRNANIEKTGTHDDPDMVQDLREYLNKMLPHQKKDFFKNITDVLHSDERADLCYYLGKAEELSVSKDILSLCHQYKRVDLLSQMDLVDWFNKRNKSVCYFLQGIGKLDAELNETLVSKTNIIPLVRAIEQVYMIRYTNFISPLSFLTNVCIYTMTGSKACVNLCGSSNPAGHYSTVTKWLKEQGTEEQKCPAGDLINVFDNEQVISRKSGIKSDHKSSVSVITNKGFVVLDAHGVLQQNKNLQPLHTLKLKDGFTDQNQFSNLKECQYFQSAVDQIISQSSENHKKMENDHFIQLCYFLQTAINDVRSEQNNKNGKVSDKIDELVLKEQQKESGVVCSTCGTLNRKRKIVCTGCNERDGLKKSKVIEKNVASEPKKKDYTETFHRLEFEKISNVSTSVRRSEQSLYNEQSRYEHVISNHVKPHELVLTDPVFCNPNSLETVARVLRKIGKENGIIQYGGTRRYWTFICCDGLPYLICKKLKEEAVICAIGDCKENFLSKQQYMSHVQHHHDNVSDVSFIYEFDWFYIRIGGGHYEMNLIRSFFDLNWTPFLEALCERMGFVSDAAKMYAKACKDLHKSWHLLLIFHIAFLRELVLPYVRLCSLILEVPTAKGFLQYSDHEYKSESRSNYKYAFDQVLIFSQGIINYRMGIRRNNADLCKSAKYMTKEIFHGRSHPKYQKIEIYDTLQDTLMPKDVIDLNDSFASITTSGNNSAGQDFDFVLEEKNRQLKAWIPKRTPTDQIWQTVCRNDKKLEKVKLDTLSLLGVVTEKGARNGQN